MAFDANPFANLHTFEDYNKLNQAFQLQRAQQIQQMQTAGTQNLLQQDQLNRLQNGTLTPQEQIAARLKLAEINANNPSIFAAQHPITLEDIMGGNTNPAPPAPPSQPNIVAPSASGTVLPTNASAYVPAVTQVESGGSANAVSPAGATGTMQVMPATAAQPGFGIKPSNGTPEDTQRVGAEYLNAMFTRYPGRPDLALQAYNGGPGRIDKVVNETMQPSQLPQETQDYPGKVFAAGGWQKPQSPADLESARPTATPGQSLVQPSNTPYHLPIPAEGQKLLDSLQPEYKARVQGYIDGSIPLPPPGSLARSGPGGKIANQLMDAALQIDPGLTEARYPAMKEFVTPNSKTASTVKSFGVALSHLDVLSGLANALNNGDVQAINAAGNAVHTQLGVAAPNSFEGAKQIVGDELIKAVVGAGGGEGDRQALQKTLSQVNSPSQLADMIATYKQLMGGQISGFKQQYESASGGRSDFFDRFLPAQKTQLTNILSGNPAPITANTMQAKNNTLRTPSGIPYKVIQ